jgi:hypothetical protein
MEGQIDFKKKCGSGRRHATSCSCKEHASSDRTFILFLAELQANLFDDFSYPAWPWILNTGLSFNELTLFVFEGHPLNVPDVASKVSARNAGVSLWPMFCIEAAENPAAFDYQQK